MPPSSAVLEELEAASQWDVTSWADIYEFDGVTPFLEKAPITGGQVNLDWSRDERRSLSISLKNDGLVDELDDFGYDKIIRPWYQVSVPGGPTITTQLGEFYIDNFNEEAFPKAIEMSCRDGASRLLAAKFPATTSFDSGLRIEDLIKTIALNEGTINKFKLPATGQRTNKVHTFDRSVTRWQACKDVANAYGYELFFDSSGFLTMEPMSDPILTPQQMTFRTGPLGNVSKYTKRKNKERIYNHVVVTGEGADPPIFYEVENDDPNSPISISRIGRRTYEFVSQFFTTLDQVENTAKAFLEQHGLEEREIDLETRVFPWLDVGRVSRFDEDSPDPGDPPMYMTTTITIPLGLGSMSVNLKRVVML
jgi:hypothetical protein